MSDEIKFQCEECGKSFPADPDTMLEIEMGGECPCCNGKKHGKITDEMIESGEAITGEQLVVMSAEELAPLGLTPETRDALLRGETVSVGAACICKECQDRMENEQANQ